MSEIIVNAIITEVTNLRDSGLLTQDEVSLVIQARYRNYFNLVAVNEAVYNIYNRQPVIQEHHEEQHEEHHEEHHESNPFHTPSLYPEIKVKLEEEEEVQPVQETPQSDASSSSSSAKKQYKPRGVADEEHRCMARTFYEDKHLEGGFLKIVREDEKNLFGDRCINKKKDGGFCGLHLKSQPLGVWNGEYANKFKKHLDRYNSLKKVTKDL